MRQFIELQSGKIAYSVDELSDRTSLSKPFLRNEIRSGRLKAKKVGRRVLVMNQDLDEYLSNLGSAEKVGNK